MRISVLKLRVTFIPDGRKILKVKVNFPEYSIINIFLSRDVYVYCQPGKQHGIPTTGEPEETLVREFYSLIGTVQVKVTQCLNPDKSCGGGDLVLEDYDTYCHQVGSIIFSIRRFNPEFILTY